MNKNLENKYIVVEDLKFNEYFRDNDGNIKLIDTIDEANQICGIYEFKDVLILKVVSNYIEKD